MSHEHIIHRLNFDIHGLKTNQEFQRIANRISAIVRSSLSSRLDRLLNNLNVSEFHIIINSLELDIGLINIHNLENSIISKIEKQLNKIIPTLKAQLLYKINKGEFDLLGEHAYAGDQISAILKNNLLNLSEPIKADVDVRFNISKKITESRVIPANSRYLDAVIHYMEHGYFSRNLYISDEVFSQVFTNTVLKYEKEVFKYLENKSTSQKQIALERFQKQLSGSALLKEKTSATKKRNEKLFDHMYHEKLQAVVKSIESLSGDKTSSEKRKKEILDYVAKLYKSQKSITDLAKIFKQTDQRIKKKLESTTKKIDANKDLLPGDQAILDFKEKLNKLLDERDRTAFNEFLKSPFVQSLGTSYVSKIDSMEVLSQALLQLISDPSKKAEIFRNLPSYLENEADLITQIYKKSPAVITSIFSRSNALAISSSSSNVKSFSADNTRKFLHKLPKKHLNLVLQSTISYYQRLAPALNFINEVHQQLSIPMLRNSSAGLQANHVAQVELFISILESTANTSTTIDRFVEKAFTEIEKIISKKKSSKNSLETDKQLSQTLSKSKHAQYSKVQKLLKARSFQASEKILQLSVENVLSESASYQKDPAALVVYQLETLLSQYYIPFAVVNSVPLPSTVDSLIKNLVKHQKNKQKAKITALFEGKKILRNATLRNLTYENFKSLLSIALPTDAMRRFIRLFEKYDYIWKNTIDQAEAQLIFLSLIENHKQINEATIFNHYFSKLRDFKAWTHDVQRKRIVENYELHREKLREEVRAVIIQYIDDIPTLESMAFKESRKKLESGVPVKNAGLVLLWPFFKTLFGLCDYLTPKGDFIDSISRERAALLLQYMAVKSSTVEEPYLALNKILTGFPLDKSIANEIILTDKEKDIADALLLNVIKQWPSFQNSSADNLRGSFLIRDGILYFKGGQWVLQVENKAYDLLLGKLPWGFSLIRLSWLTYMVKVEWN